MDGGKRGGVGDQRKRANEKAVLHPSSVRPDWGRGSRGSGQDRRTSTRCALNGSGKIRMGAMTTGPEWTPMKALHALGGRGSQRDVRVLVYVDWSRMREIHTLHTTA